MLHILRFWASKGVDGFRCDMVFMVPLAFWHWAIPQVKQDYPSIIFIGEIYDVGLYRPFLDYGCFDYLYDKVNLYDKLVGIERHNFSAAQLTAAWQTVDGIGHRMLNMTGMPIIITMWYIPAAERRKLQNVLNAASARRPVRSIFTSVTCWPMWRRNLKIAEQ